MNNTQKDASSNSKKFFEDEFIAKILILGDSEVGKSAILCRYVENVFRTNNVPTIGAN